MRRDIAFGLTFVTIGLAGCAAMMPKPRAQDCQSATGKCEVTTTVTEPCNAPGNIVVSPHTLVLDGNADVKITWELKGDYRFCEANDDEVMFKPNQDLKFQFYSPGWEQGAGQGCHKRFRWFDRNNNWTWNDQWSYYIRFTGPNGTCYVDPFIRNG